MKAMRFAAHVSSLSAACLLAACSGGGGASGGVSSTPAPVSYPKFDELSGDQTFQSAGVRFFHSPQLIPVAREMGRGMTARYFVNSDDIEIAVPGWATTVNFTSSDHMPSLSSGSVEGFSKSDGTGFTLFVETPKVNNVTLSYTRVATFIYDVSGEVAVFGVPTKSGDVPTNGSASYSGNVRGYAETYSDGYNISSSAVTFTANFGSGSVETSIALKGTSISGGAPASFGTLVGSGAIGSSAGFSGTFAAPFDGVFSGAFFGPKGEEMGYGFSAVDDDFVTYGAVVGKKN